MENRYLVWLEWPEACFRTDDAALAHLRAHVRGEVVRVRDEAAFLAELPSATHAIVWNFKPEWFASAKRLKLLASPCAGREFMPVTGPAGVTVHFGGFHGRIIAESVVAFALAWVRGFFLMDAVRRREPSLVADLDDGERVWPRLFMSDKCRKIAGTRAVIVGYGRIGRTIGDRLSALGVTVEGFSRRNIDALPAALGTADWLILALPSDTGTDGFLSAELLARVPSRCVVVNVGRGNAIDETALLDALENGRLAGAYLDVFRGEPTMKRGELGVQTGRTGPILTRAEKGELPWNLVMMPHSSAFSPEYVTDCFKELIDEGLV